MDGNPSNYRPGIFSQDIFSQSSLSITPPPVNCNDESRKKYARTNRDGSVSLRCLDKQCKGTANLKDGIIETRKPCSMIHLPDPAKIEAMRLMAWGKALKMQGCRAMKVCQMIRQRASEDVLRHLPSLENLARPLHRACSPSALDSIPLVCSGDEPAFMFNGISTLVYNDTEHALNGLGMIILANSGATEALKSGSGHIFLDGERKRNPRHFYQTYNVGTFHDGFYYHLFVVFLQCATEEVYTKMLNRLKMLYDFGSVKVAHMDFEISMINAVKNALPEVDVALCVFHMQQSMLKQFEKKGLNVASNDASQIAQLLLSLRFIPYTEARVAFREICGLVPQVSQEDRVGVQACLKYVAKTYIGWNDEAGTEREPRFSPCLWSINERLRKSWPVTNNASECQNSHFGQFCPMPHPSMSTYLFAMNEMWDKMAESKRHGSIDKYYPPDALPNPSGFAKKLVAVLGKPRDPNHTMVQYLQRFRTFNLYAKVVEGVAIPVD